MDSAVNGWHARCVDTTLAGLELFLMKTVTVCLDDEVARWALARAAQPDASLSALIGDLLREAMLRDSRYQTERQQPPIGETRVNSNDGRYPSRDSLYDRPGPH